MFWLPIASLAAAVHGAVSVKNGISNARRKSLSEAKHRDFCRFTMAMEDKELEASLREKYNKKYDLAYDTVFGFVGVELDRSKHPLIHKIIEWAIAAEMASVGKLPFMMSFGDMNVITHSREEHIFVEKFFLALEKALQKNGVDTFIVYETDYGVDKLADFVEANGFGKTQEGLANQYLWADTTYRYFR